MIVSNICVETADQLYQLIEQDLMDAIAALPEKSQYSSSELGRATKSAARGLLTKVHLFQDDYANAYDYALEVINSGEYSLYTDYTTLFTRQGENSSESVFEVQSTSMETREGGSQYNQIQGVRGSANLGWGFNNPTDDLEADFEPGDIRQASTILYVWEHLPNSNGQGVLDNPNMEDEKYNQKSYISPGISFSAIRGMGRELSAGCEILMSC